MRDRKALLEWEYEVYRGKKKKTTPVAAMAVIALLVLGIVLVVATGCGAKATDEEPERVAESVIVEPVEVREIKTEPAIYIIEEANDRIEAPDEQVEEEPEQEKEKLNRIENAKITAYCICRKCCGKDESHPDYGITASGRAAEPMVSVAVDPGMIPLGSAVYIDYGDGLLYEFRADDTGGSVIGGHVDVCYPDHEAALEHGVKRATVYWEVRE